MDCVIKRAAADAGCKLATKLPTTLLNKRASRRSVIWCRGGSVNELLFLVSLRYRSRAGIDFVSDCHKNRAFKMDMGGQTAICEEWTSNRVYCCLHSGQYAMSYPRRRLRRKTIC